MVQKYNMNWYKKIANKIVTFDFDSSLTIPQWDGYEWFESMMPNWRNINLLKRLAKLGYEIHIVTSRDSRQMHLLDPKYSIENFLEDHDLSALIKDIHYTGGDKADTLQDLGSIRHYDDSPHEIEGARSKGIRGRKVPHVNDEGQGLPPAENKVWQKSMKADDNK